MAENKTKATGQGPGRYIAAIGDAERRHDCEQLVALMSKATKHPAAMWGSAIVGFGVHRYALAGGKQGEICAVGFSSRKGDISIYGVLGAPGADALLAKLGKYERGKGCLYVARLADVDMKALGQLVTQAFKHKQAAPLAREVPKAGLKQGDPCIVKAGTHVGKSGTVADLNVSKTGHETLTVVQKDGVRFKTLARNVERGKRAR